MTIERERKEKKKRKKKKPDHTCNDVKSWEAPDPNASRTKKRAATDAEALTPRRRGDERLLVAHMRQARGSVPSPPRRAADASLLESWRSPTGTSAHRGRRGSIGRRPRPSSCSPHPWWAASRGGCAGAATWGAARLLLAVTRNELGWEGEGREREDSMNRMWLDLQKERKIKKYNGANEKINQWKRRFTINSDLEHLAGGGHYLDEKNVPSSQ